MGLFLYILLVLVLAVVFFPAAILALLIGILVLVARPKTVAVWPGAVDMSRWSKKDRKAALARAAAAAAAAAAAKDSREYRARDTVPQVAASPAAAPAPAPAIDRSRCRR